MPGGSPLAGLLIYIVIASSPTLLFWLALRLLPFVAARIGAVRAARRPPPPPGPSLETVVASLRRLRREIRDVPPTTIVRAQALAAAYDQVLLDACRIVGVDAPLVDAPEVDRPFARLLTEAALEDAGITLDPPGREHFPTWPA